jgi:monoamine oxidase
MKLHRRGSGRSALFGEVARAMTLAHASNQPGAPPVDELIEMDHQRRLTRRDFLKASLATAGAAALSGTVGPWLLPATAAAQPRIVIVGAGIAGLNAANHLRNAGLRAALYEGSSRTSGRMFSRHNVMGPGLVTEFGGEFVDSDHTDMLALIRRFNLSLIDTFAPSEERLTRTFYFGGRHYTQRQVIEELRPYARRIAADNNRVPDDVGYQHPGGPAVIALDRMSINQYLQHIGVRGWLYDFLTIAWVNEDGLDTDEQSALNLIGELGTTFGPGGHWDLYGLSNQRYKVRGGNQQVPDILADYVRSDITLGHKLVAISPRGSGLSLSFERSGGSTVDVAADLAIITIPFTTLRDVDITVPLPPIKWKAIRELGYGTNAKLFLGFQTRLWRNMGYTGEMYSDLPLQCGWDNTQLQPGTLGGYTLYFGGKAGVLQGERTAQQRAAEYLPQLNQIYRGAAAQFNTRVSRMDWPVYPWTLASYSTYKPGQTTGISGAERLTVGPLFFAGEHTSDFQGFMNGGAESGRVAAEAVLRRLGRRSLIPALREAVFGRAAVG